MLVLVCYGFKMFSFPILNSPLRFSDKGHKEAIVIPATCTANGLRCFYGGKDLIRQVFRKVTFSLKIG